jgi:hypothetical protein
MTLIQRASDLEAAIARYAVLGADPAFAGTPEDFIADAEITGLARALSAAVLSLVD